MRDIDPTASEYITSGYLDRSRPGGVLYDLGSIVGSIAGPLIGGFLGNEAANSGIAAQEAGAARSDATQRYIYDQSRADNAGTRARGDAAGNRLSYLMGLDGEIGGGAGSSNASSTAPYTPSTSSFGDRTGISWIDRIPGMDQLFNDIFPNTQQGTPERAAQIESLSPEQRQALEAARAADPAYGSLSRSFSEAAPEMRQFGAEDYANDFVAQNGLQFGLDEGRRGIERQQQASGGLLSGATLKALSRFGNDYGTRNTAGAYDRFTGEQNRDYGQYVDRYNRFNTDQGTQFNRLSGIAGTGQAATSQVGAAGQNYANAVGQTAQGLGNAQGAAAIAQGNAWSGGIQSGINNYQQNRLIDMYGQRGGSGVGMGGSGQSVWGSGNAFSGTGDY